MAKWKEMIKTPVIRGTEQIILRRGKQLVMENCKQVIYCGPEKMILRGGVLLTVEGKGLRLLELGNENVEVIGAIRCVYIGEKA